MHPTVDEGARINDLTIVTTCKGRRHHLAQTLPLMLRTAAQVIVVDGDNNAAEWMSTGATVVALDSPWNKSNALNAGICDVETTWTMLVDADVMLNHPSIVDAAAGRLKAFSFLVVGYTPNGANIGLTGWIACRTRALRSIGFESNMVGWGAEDLDMRVRLHLHGYFPVFMPPGEVGHHIEHDDHERVRFQSQKDIRKSLDANTAIMAENYERIAGRSLEEGLRFDGTLRALLQTGDRRWL